jgi:hypothetical protein
MAHSSQGDKWQTLSVEEKLDALHEDIGKLFGVAEEISHRQHVFTDAIYRLQGKLEDHARALHTAKKRVSQPEMVN